MTESSFVTFNRSVVEDMKKCWVVKIVAHHKDDYNRPETTFYYRLVDYFPGWSVHANRNLARRMTKEGAKHALFVLLMHYGDTPIDFPPNREWAYKFEIEQV